MKAFYAKTTAKLIPEVQIVIAGAVGTATVCTAVNVIYGSVKDREYRDQLLEITQKNIKFDQYIKLRELAQRDERMAFDREQANNTVINNVINFTKRWCSWGAKKDVPVEKDQKKVEDEVFHKLTVDSDSDDVTAASSFIDRSTDI